MFGALNRFISRLDSDGPSPNSSTNPNAFGFQVLRNKNADIPIEPWYDFIIGINGRPIDSQDPALFATEIRNCAGSNVALALWSAKVCLPPRSSFPPLPIQATYAKQICLRTTGPTHTHRPHFRAPTERVSYTRPNTPMDLSHLLRKRLAHPRRDAALSRRQRGSPPLR